MKSISLLSNFYKMPNAICVLQYLVQKKGHFLESTFMQIAFLVTPSSENLLPWKKNPHYSQSQYFPQDWTQRDYEKKIVLFS